jgi:outer membrane protein
MSRSLLIKAIIAITFIAGTSFIVQRNVSAAPEGGGAFKIGYVDLQDALQSVDAGKKAKAQLEKDMTAKRSDLEKQQQNLQKEAEQFEKKAAIMNDGAKSAKQAELQKKFSELQKAAAESQMELQKRERELTKPIIDELRSIVEGLGKAQHFNLVLEKNEGAVLYAQNGIDLTKEVIESFNTRAKKGKKK